VRSLCRRLGIVREHRGKGTFAVGSRYQATTNENMTVDTSVCVCVCVCIILNSKMLSQFIKESNKSKTRLYTHAYM
jgi:hypothetical protein